MLAYDEIGTGSPVLLLPGLASRRLWDPLLALWPDGVRGIRVDYPGFGASPPTDPPTPAAVAREVVALLDRLGLARAPVGGLSLGGWVGLEVARAGRATAVLAMGPAGLWRRHSPLVTDLQLNAGFAGAQLPRPLRTAPLRSRALRALAMSAQSARPADLEPAWLASAIEDTAGARGWLRLFLATRRERFTGGQGIDVPVRVVFGAQDRIALRSRSRHRDELPAHATWEEWEGCGHVLVWDAPRRVMAAIEDIAAAGGQGARRTAS